MKKVLSIVVLLVSLVFVPSVYAKSLNFEWTFTETAESTIDGYRIYQVMDLGNGTTGKVEVWSNSDPSARTGQFELATELTECRTYYITAVKSGINSLPSNTAGVCPETDIPDVLVRPGTTVNFTVKIID